MPALRAFESSGFTASLFKRDNDKFPFGSSAFLSLFTGGYEISVNITLPNSALSLVVCAAVYTILKREANRVKSPVLRAESKTWLLDTLLSLASLSAKVFSNSAGNGGFSSCFRFARDTRSSAPLILAIALSSHLVLMGNSELSSQGRAPCREAILRWVFVLTSAVQ